MRWKALCMELCYFTIKSHTSRAHLRVPDVEALGVLPHLGHTHTHTTTLAPTQHLAKPVCVCVCVHTALNTNETQWSGRLAGVLALRGGAGTCRGQPSRAHGLPAPSTRLRSRPARGGSYHAEGCTIESSRVTTLRVDKVPLQPARNNPMLLRTYLFSS